MSLLPLLCVYMMAIPQVNTYVGYRPSVINNGDWFDAEAYCVSEHCSHLASIHDSTESNTVKNICYNLPAADGCWIGFRGGGTTSGSWEWSDNSDYSYLNFYNQAEIDKGSSTNMCAYFYSGSYWYGAACSNTGGNFVCNEGSCSPTTSEPTTFKSTTYAPTISPTIQPTTSPTTSFPTTSPTFSPTTRIPTSFPTYLPTSISPITSKPTASPTEYTTLNIITSLTSDEHEMTVISRDSSTDGVTNNNSLDPSEISLVIIGCLMAVCVISYCFYLYFKRNKLNYNYKNDDIDDKHDHYVMMSDDYNHDNKLDFANNKVNKITNNDNILADEFVIKGGIDKTVKTRIQKVAIGESFVCDSCSDDDDIDDVDNDDYKIPKDCPCKDNMSDKQIMKLMEVLKEKNEEKDACGSVSKSEFIRAIQDININMNANDIVSVYNDLTNNDQNELTISRFLEFLTNKMKDNKDNGDDDIIDTINTIQVNMDMDINDQDENIIDAINTTKRNMNMMIPTKGNSNKQFIDQNIDNLNDEIIVGNDDLATKGNSNVKYIDDNDDDGDEKDDIFNMDDKTIMDAANIENDDDDDDDEDDIVINDATIIG